MLTQAIRFAEFFAGCADHDESPGDPDSKSHERLCGLGHGVMGAKLVVEGPEEHAAWLQQHAQDAALAALETAPADSSSKQATPAPAGAR